MLTETTTETIVITYDKAGRVMEQVKTIVHVSKEDVDN